MSKKLLISTLTFFLGYAIGKSLWSGLAFFVGSYAIFDLVEKLGQYFPVKELMLSLAALQWLIAPVLAYGGYSEHYKYYMYVSQSTYFSFVLPGFLVFVVALNFFSNKLNTEQIIDQIKQHLASHPKIGTRLIIVGFLAILITPFTPSTYRFVITLIGGSMYIGAIYLMFTPRYKNPWNIAFVIFYLIFTAISAAMFHDLLLWLTFFIFFWLLIKHYSLPYKLFYLGLGFVLVVIVQIAKAEYRSYIWSGYSGNKVILFFDIVSRQLNEEQSDIDYIEPPVDDRISNLVIRFNQGWIISKIMDHIPDYVSYMKGESINMAIHSLIPRFLLKNKLKVGGEVYFERMTGFPLHGTSMGAGLIGEGYANYGIYGGWLMMFIFGAFISLYLKVFYRLVQKNPTLLLWLPLLFLQVVKAESDLMRVLNHLIKASIVVWFMYWSFRRFFGIKL